MMPIRGVGLKFVSFPDCVTRSAELGQSRKSDVSAHWLVGVGGRGGGVVREDFLQFQQDEVARQFDVGPDQRVRAEDLAAGMDDDPFGGNTAGI
jgi:hypothetical protein